VLVLHGWNGSSQTWQTFVNQEKNFNWIIPDLPGFGKTPEPPTAWTVQDYTNWVKEYIANLPQKPEYILTHSFGGRIASQLLSQPNSTFKKAILVAAAGIKSPPTLKQKIAGLLAKLKNLLPNSIQKPLQKAFYQILRIHDFPQTAVMQKTFKNVVQEDQLPNFQQIQIPIHLVWGENDTYTPLWKGKLLKQQIPNAKLTVMPNVRHGIHRQAPKELATICQEFFK